MRRIAIGFLAVLLGQGIPCLAQKWELGGVGGFGVQKGLSAKRDNASAETGFRSGPALGVFLSNDLYDRIGGEIHYLFRWSDLRVAGNGQDATFNGQSHIVHYDFLFHSKPRGSKTRPFFAVGAGVKAFEGTGLERAFQPLSQFVLLTKKREILGMFDFGGGIKWNLRNHLGFRIEVRDYLTPAPKKVLVPAPGARITGWLNDIVPTVGFAYTF